MISERHRNDGKATIRLNRVQRAAKLKVERKIASGVYQFEEAVCPVCGRAEYEHLAEKDRFGLYCNTVICKSCGLLITNPRMNQESLNQFYSDDYRELYTGSKWANAGIFSSQRKQGKRIFDFIRKYDKSISFQDKFVLEIGCGAGGILDVFRDAGAQVMGFDLGSDYLEYGVKEHNLCLKCGTIEDYQEVRKPDIIIYSHVLEHLSSPLEELKNIKKICHERTLVYIEVPGILFIYKTFGEFVRYWQSAHLYNFSLGTLKNLLSKSGFTLVFGDETVKSLSVSTPPPM
jgi:2-polyprenyl-3-methyl-5-hydroxy-6-metoxy-1,4-benzoquinol methylase